MIELSPALTIFMVLVSVFLLFLGSVLAEISCVVFLEAAGSVSSVDVAGCSTSLFMDVSMALSGEREEVGGNWGEGEGGGKGWFGGGWVCLRKKAIVSPVNLHGGGDGGRSSLCCAALPSACTTSCPLLSLVLSSQMWVSCGLEGGWARVGERGVGG